MENVEKKDNQEESVTPKDEAAAPEDTSPPSENSDQDTEQKTTSEDQDTSEDKETEAKEEAAEDGEKAEEADKESEDDDDSPVTLDIDKYQELYEANEGKLPDEAYQELAEKHNIPKEIVDNYIALNEDKTQQHNQELMDIAGGSQEDVNNLVTWTGENLSPEECSVLREQIDSGDFNKQKLAFKTMAGEYKAVNGSEPNLTTANATGTNTAADSFSDYAEYKAASLKRDKNGRFQTDNQDYANALRAKLTRSPFFKKQT